MSCAVPMSPTPSLKPTTFGFCASRTHGLDRVLRRAAVVDHDGQVGCRGDRFDVRHESRLRAAHQVGGKDEESVGAGIGRGPRDLDGVPERTARAGDHGDAPADGVDGHPDDGRRFGSRERVVLAGAARGEDAAGCVLERAPDVGAQEFLVDAAGRVEGSHREEEDAVEVHVGWSFRVSDSLSSVRQVCSGRQPSRRRALAFEKAGEVPVSAAAAAAVPGWKRGRRSASGSRARASSAPTKKTSPLGMSPSAASSVSAKAATSRAST